MNAEHPFDLYTWVERLCQAEWVHEVHIFGSRRYSSNSSFGSDIDLLIVPNREVSLHEVRSVIDERYIDAFVLKGNSTAVSTANETTIPVSHDKLQQELDSL